MVIWHLKQIGKVKKHNRWVPQIKKNCCLEVSSCLIICNNNESFLDQMWYVTKSGFSTDDDQLSGWTMNKLPKHFPKPTYTKKGSWSLLLYAACLINYSFLNPGETTASEKYAQRGDEMHWKRQCGSSTGQQNGPVLLHDNAWLS